MKFLDNHGEKILYITWGILFLIILIAGCDVKAKAAGEENNYDLPFQFSSIDNYQTWLDTSTYNSIMGSIETYGLPIYDDDYVLVLVDYSFYGFEGSYSIYRAWFKLVPIDEFATPADNFNWTSNALQYTHISNLPSYYFGVHYDIYNGFTPIVFNVNNNYSDNFSLFNHAPTQLVRSDKTIYYTTYTPVWFGRNYYGGNKLVLSTGGSSGDLVTGHAVEPNLNDDNVDPNDLPDISNHLPTISSPPTVDTSSPSTLLNSIFELLEWGFKALISTINGLLSYIGDLLSYLTQLLINNIKNAIDNIYQNFKQLFEPLLNGITSLTQNISDKIDYITAPIDPAAISTGIETTDLATDVTGYKTALTTFIGTFNSVSEPSTYKIPIHFENITMFSDVGVQYIDLGWLNSVKTIIRGFVACLVTYGVIISIFDSVPNYINGGGGEDD